MVESGRLKDLKPDPVGLTSNDDWWQGTTVATMTGVFSSVGAFPLAAGSRDAALVATLQPGSYTVQVTGADGATGGALVEVYEVP